MHLQELLLYYQGLQSHASLASTHASPDWMLGCFKRQSITFANGKTDRKTRVFWLQGRQLTIDLRLPLAQDQVQHAWPDCSAKQLRSLANYEGWSADSRWHNGQLSWQGGASFQIHNRWPEPAILHRVGDCMVELAPHGSYVEDWRAQSTQPGPLVSLRLIDETHRQTSQKRSRGGAIIIAGNWAGLIIGRKKEPRQVPHKQLRDLVSTLNTTQLLSQLFDFEASVATGNIQDGYVVQHSIHVERQAQPLLPLDGFELCADERHVIQHLDHQGDPILRRFEIDTLVPKMNFGSHTPWHPQSAAWFQRESETLTRYT